MLKKFLCCSALVAFVLSACSSDNSASPGGVSEEKTNQTQKDLVLYDTTKVYFLDNLSSTDQTLDKSSSSGQSLDNNKQITTEDRSSSSSVNPPSGGKNATCVVKEKDDLHITIYMVQPDSGSITMTSSYQEGLYRTLVVFELDPAAPRDSFDEACADMKKDPDMTSIVCEDRKITATIDESSVINPIPLISSEIVGYCNQIQTTGFIPEDD